MFLRGRGELKKGLTSKISGGFEICLKSSF